MITTSPRDSETPAKGQQVITACVFIHATFNGVEKVFLAKRADTKKFLPGVYELPGGHIEFAEDLIEGLKREIREEFAMNISVGDPFDVSAYVNHVKGSHSIQVSYFAKFTDPIEKIILDPASHSGFAWFAESELHVVVETNRSESDPEIMTVRKGFALLKGTRALFS